MFTLSNQWLMTFPPSAEPEQGSHVCILYHEAKNIAFSRDNFNSKIFPFSLQHLYSP